MAQTYRMGRVLLVATLTLAIGCKSRDERLAEFAQRANEEQARQNEQMAEQSQAVARQSQELATASKQLVEQDAIARRELLQAQERLQGGLDEQRTTLDRQRQDLLVERQAAAAAAIREPFIAQAIVALALILAALLPLIVTAYALRRLPEPSTSADLLAGSLLEELAAKRLNLPPSPPATLAESSAPLLPDS